MNKIKLYMLTNLNGEIIALSEYKEYMQMYIIQNRYTTNEVQVYTIKHTDYCDKLLIENDDNILEEYGNYVLTRRDIKIPDHFISEERSRINSIIYDLSFIYKNYDLSEKKSKKIRQVLELLSDINIEDKIMKSFNMTLLEDNIYVPKQNNNEILNEISMNDLLDKL